MKDWPALLLFIGFMAGVIFHGYRVDSGGGKTSNLWIIWAVTMLCFVMTGIILSHIKAKQKN